MTEVHTIERQKDLPEGSKVLIRNPDGMDFTTMKFLSMTSTHLGLWDIAGVEMKGNLYGKFHWNASQLYYYYEDL